MYNDIKIENVGLWFMNDDENLKICLKAPSNVIRSIINNSKMDLLFGKDNYHKEVFLHMGIKIYDDKVNPFIITQPIRILNDYYKLKTFLKKETIVIEFYDELTTCSVIAELKILKNERLEIYAFFHNSEKKYFGDFIKKLSSSMDSFIYSIDESQKTSASYKIPIKSASCQIYNFTVIDKVYIGFKEIQELNISSEDEGSTFEKQIWFSLESLFNSDIYLNPTILEGNKSRELTDILAHHKYGNFLIETKALGVFNLTKEQNIDRRSSNIKNQVLKGIKQLIGANKSIQKSFPICKNSGNEIIIDKSLVPHCIVLVSELIVSGNWKKVEMEIIRAMINEKIYLHVMDYNELMKYLKASNGQKERFDYFLMERAEKFIKNGGKINIMTSFI